jgi:hypothetical protein
VVRDPTDSDPADLLNLRRSRTLRSMKSKIIVFSAIAGMCRRDPFHSLLPLRSIRKTTQRAVENQRKQCPHVAARIRVGADDQTRRCSSVDCGARSTCAVIREGCCRPGCRLRFQSQRILRLDIFTLYGASAGDGDRTRDVRLGKLASIDNKQQWRLLRPFSEYVDTPSFTVLPFSPS